MSILPDTKFQVQEDTVAARMDRGGRVRGLRLAQVLGALSRLDGGREGPLGGDRCSSEALPLPVVVDAPLHPLVQGYVDVLMKVVWEWFCTFTFANPRTHPESALKSFDLWLVKMNRVLYGPNWRRKRLGVTWVLGLEPTKAGTVHFHGAILGVGNTSRSAAKERWASNGFSKIEDVREAQRCCSYVAKYVVKGGEVYFGGPGWGGVEGARDCGRADAGTIQGDSSLQRRYVERAPLFASGEHSVSEVYANGFLRPDEVFERNERMEEASGKHSGGKWAALEAANWVTVRERARSVRG